MKLESGNIYFVVTQEEVVERRKQSAARKEAFFEFWKKGVGLAGVEFFGDGTNENFARATEIDNLAPDIKKVKGSLGYLSPGEAAFLASMYSFYNSYDAADFCNIANVKSVGDLVILDEGRREVIAGLLINYSGW